MAVTEQEARALAQKRLTEAMSHAKHQSATTMTSAEADRKVRPQLSSAAARCRSQPRSRPSGPLRRPPPLLPPPPSLPHPSRTLSRVAGCAAQVAADRGAGGRGAQGGGG